MNISRKKLRLGDLLVENRIIQQEQLDAALEEQRKLGRKLGRILIDKGHLSEDALLSFLSHQLSVPFVDLADIQFETALVQLLPEIYARRFRALVLQDKGSSLLIGMSDPTNLFAYDELARILARPIDIAVVREQELLDVIERVYKQNDRISGIAEQLSDELRDGDFDVIQFSADADMSEAPVVKLLHTLFQSAVQSRASDIHIEPDENVLRIRQRVDGVLLEQTLNEKRIAPALVQRLKLLAELDIAEKRLPQDGRFSVTVGERQIDVRVSTMPLQHGESVVMRLLDHREGVKNLDSLGMPPALLRRFTTAIRRPHGMVVVTGPTGSGKTSTLYSALKVLNEARYKIVTVEDPVEYRLPRVNQIQVNAQIGLTFARVLRTTLRQDPDIILVGEIRDLETASIAVKAAQTGHMVMSTLHTNDAPQTLTRLQDMGVAPFAVATTINLITAQRLARRLQPDLRVPIDAPPEALLKEGFSEADVNAGFRLYGPGSSSDCPSGYKGRVGIYQVMPVSDAMKRLIIEGANAVQLADQSNAEGIWDIRKSGLNKARLGMTSLAEINRVTVE